MSWHQQPPYGRESDVKGGVKWVQSNLKQNRHLRAAITSNLLRSRRTALLRPCSTYHRNTNNNRTARILRSKATNSRLPPSSMEAQMRRTTGVCRCTSPFSSSRKDRARAMHNHHLVHHMFHNTLCTPQRPPLSGMMLSKQSTGTALQMQTP